MGSETLNAFENQGQPETLVNMLDHESGLLMIADADGKWQTRLACVVGSKIESEPPTETQRFATHQHSHAGTKEQGTREQTHRHNIAAAMVYLLKVGKGRSLLPGEASLASVVDGATQALLIDDANLDAAFPVRIWAAFQSRPRTSNRAPLAHGRTAAPGTIILAHAVVESESEHIKPKSAEGLRD